MPEIDHVVLAEYVRQDAGMTHITGAGVDTFYVPEGRPMAVPVGNPAVCRISGISQGVTFSHPAGTEVTDMPFGWRQP